MECMLFFYYFILSLTSLSNYFLVYTGKSCLPDEKIFLTLTEDSFQLEKDDKTVRNYKIDDMTGFELTQGVSFYVNPMKMNLFFHFFHSFILSSFFHSFLILSFFYSF